MSASEVALFSLSRFQLRQFRAGQAKSHPLIKQLLSDPSGLLFTILVGNELLNIALSTLLGSWLSQFPTFQSPWGASLGVMLVVTPVLLIFCEVTPKVLGSRLNQFIAPRSVRPLTFLYRLLTPLRWVFSTLLVQGFQSKKQRAKAAKAMDTTVLLKEDEFLMLVEETKNEGLVHEGELELIRNIFHLDDSQVQQIFEPLSQITCVPAQASLQDCHSLIRNKWFSRIPVYENGKKHIVGILFAKDVLLAKTRSDFAKLHARDLMRKPFFVSPDQRLNQLFRAMKRNKAHIAIVANNPQTALGIVTMTDLLDEVFEDFFEVRSKRTAP